MTGKCETCAKRNDCRKTCGIMFGFCNIDYQPDERIQEVNGLYIEHDFYGNGEYSVQFCGDDIMFDTLDEAVAFCMSA